MMVGFARLAAGLGAALLTGFSISGQALAKDEVSCSELISDALVQAALDRRALGGDPVALATRAACTWPLKSAPDKSKDKGKTPEPREASPAQIVEAFFWSALDFCKSEDPDDLTDKKYVSRGSPKDDKRRERFLSVKSALNRLPNETKARAYNTYMQRLAAMRAPGLIELARTAECAVDANRATMYGVLSAAITAWSAVPDVSTKWDEKWNPVLLRSQIFIEGAELEQANVIMSSLLAGLADEPSELRERAAIANVDNFTVRDLQWLLFDLKKITDFRGPMNDKYSTSIKAIEKLTAEAGRPGSSLNNNGKPLIHSDKDQRLTNREVRNLVCWASADTAPRPTRAISLAYLGWMYAKGNGVPKDLLKARAILRYSVPQIDDIIAALGTSKDAKDSLRALKQGSQALQANVEQEIQIEGLSGQDDRPFKMDKTYLCPDVFREVGARPASPAPAPGERPAIGFAPEGAGAGTVFQLPAPAEVPQVWPEVH